MFVATATHWRTNPFVSSPASVFVITGVVSLGLFDEHGSPVAVSGLDTPVVFGLDPAATPATYLPALDGFQCAYFDHSTRDWSLRGVVLVAFDASGQPMCASLHLTEFVGLSAGQLGPQRSPTPVTITAIDATIPA